MSRVLGSRQSIAAGFRTKALGLLYHVPEGEIRTVIELLEAGWELNWDEITSEYDPDPDGPATRTRARYRQSIERLRTALRELEHKGLIKNTADKSEHMSKHWVITANGRVVAEKEIPDLADFKL